MHAALAHRHFRCRFRSRAKPFWGPGALAWRVPNGYADADLRRWPAQLPLHFAGLPSSCLGFHVPPRQTPQAIVAVLPQLAQCLSSRNDLQTAETTQQGQSEDYEMADA